MGVGVGADSGALDGGRQNRARLDQKCGEHYFIEWLDASFMRSSALVVYDGKGEAKFWETRSWLSGMVSARGLPACLRGVFHVCVCIYMFIVRALYT